MTVCRDVPDNLQRNWQNIGEMYTALGVRRSGDNGPGLAPPSTYADSQTLSYMVGLSGGPRRSIDISIFNDRDARACFYRWAGYDETTINARITAIRNEHPDDQEAADTAVQAYLNTLPHLQQQIYRVVGMISIFQQDYRMENGHNVGGGNRPKPDSHESANPNIITDFEIQQYAAEALDGGDQNPNYEATGGRILSGINGIIGLMTYLTTPPPPPVVRPGTEVVAGHAYDIAAPDGGWHAGDHIFVGTTELSGVPTSGTNAFTIPATNLPVGNQTVEIRRENGSIIRTSLVVRHPETPPPPRPEPSAWARVWNEIPGWVKGAVGTAAAFGLIAGIRRMFRHETPTPTNNGRDTTPPRGGSGDADGRAEARVDVRVETQAPGGGTSGGSRVVADTTTPSQPEQTEGVTRVVEDTAGDSTPPSNKTRIVADDDMADLAAELDNLKMETSPAPIGTPASTTGITADNVIMRDENARPTAELSKPVVMAEIAALYPKFLTEDGSAIHSNFRSGVESLAELAMSQFGNRGADDPKPIDLWRIEQGRQHSMVRGGLPEAWLREFVNTQLEQWHASNAPGMSFSADTRAGMERDSERRADPRERPAYEGFIERALRDPVVLGGL